MERGNNIGAVIEKAGINVANPVNGVAAEVGSVSVKDEHNIARPSDLYKNLRDPRMPIPQESRDRGHYLVRNRCR